MKISFIIPVYNGEQYLETCLESLAAQSFMDMEVIMINDGSTDKSSDICHRYEAKDKRFRTYDQRNKGAAAARNDGIVYAKGEWVCFVDSDDIIEKDFFINNIVWDNTDADIIFFGYSRLKNGIKTHVAMPKFQGTLESSVSSFFCKFILNPDIQYDEDKLPRAHVITAPWAKMYRKSFLDKYKLRFKTDLTVGEDNYFNFTVYNHHPNCYVCKKYMYIYRENTSSLTKKYNDNIIEVMIKYYDALENYIQNKGAVDEYSLFLPARAVRNFMYCCALDFCHKDNPKPFLQRRREFMILRNNVKYSIAFQKIRLSSLRCTVRIGAWLCKYKLFGLYCFSWWLTEYFHVSHA